MAMLMDEYVKLVYVAHPPKTDDDLKNKLLETLKSDNVEIIDPFALSPDLESNPDPKQRAQLAPLIFSRNVRAIQDSDWIVALVSSNNPFDPDQGVFWEVGYGLSLGRSIMLVYQEPLQTPKPFSDAESYLAFLKSITPLVVSVDELEEVWRSYRKDTLVSKAYHQYVRDRAKDHWVLHWEKDESLLDQLSNNFDMNYLSFERMASTKGILELLKYYERPTWICIDDRCVLASLTAGWLYGENIPFWTWSTKDYGSNIMIAQASFGHYTWKEFKNFWSDRQMPIYD
jgi:nucleoside 2-deoxyribosyltransferase